MGITSPSELSDSKLIKVQKLQKSKPKKNLSKKKTLSLKESEEENSSDSANTNNIQEINLYGKRHSHRNKSTKQGKVKIVTYNIVNRVDVYKDKIVKYETNLNFVKNIFSDLNKKNVSKAKYKRRKKSN